jgi:hypothetical protein
MAECHRIDAALRLVVSDAEMAAGCAYFNPDTRRDIERRGDAEALAAYDRADEAFDARFDAEHDLALESAGLTGPLFAVILDYLAWRRRDRDAFRLAVEHRRALQETRALALLDLIDPDDAPETGPPTLHVVAQPIAAHAPPARSPFVPTHHTRALAA